MESEALDARGATMGALAMMAFAGSLWGLIPRMNAVIALALSLAFWFALAALLWYVRKRHPWSRPRARRP